MNETFKPSLKLTLFFYKFDIGQKHIFIYFINYATYVVI